MGHYEADRWSLDFFAEKFPELPTQVLEHATGKVRTESLSSLVPAIKDGKVKPFQAALNWYFELSGTRHWTLVDAEYSWLLYPSSEGTGMRRFSEFLPDMEGNPMEAGEHPLLDYAPRYELELRPGDVLFHPAWMWHKTVGLEDHCTGIRFNFVAPAPNVSRRRRAGLSPRARGGCSSARGVGLPRFRARCA
jgi:hypothetical protein